MSPRKLLVLILITPTTTVQNREAEEKRKPSSGRILDGEPTRQRRETFPDLPDPASMFQKNEGDWDFVLDMDPAEQVVVLVVELGKYLDTSNVTIDVQPKVIRLLIKGLLGRGVLLQKGKGSRW